MQEGAISRVIIMPQFLQAMSGSSDHISFLWVQKAQTISSGKGVLISLLPGQLSFMIAYLLETGLYSKACLSEAAKRAYLKDYFYNIDEAIT